MRRIAELEEDTDFWGTFAGRIKDNLELVELSRDDDDATALTELENDYTAAQSELAARELDLLFSGPYDSRPALLSVNAREGGTDSQDWAEMLLRMYLRWADQQKFKVQVLDSEAGGEAGIKSATIEISGRNAYGRAKAEAGQHRLVRLSPFDSNHRRHTSFALVEVLPVVDDAIEIEIRDEDIRIDTFRATGAGGQHINKTDSAVRITHIPSGIVVSCQNERSQTQNREAAFKILRARLMEREIQRREEEQARLKGEHRATGWGSQIRSYVLHPYNLVKDHRTGQETSDTTAVLNGDIEPFVQAFLRWRVGSDDTPPEELTIDD
jgi:peptide chain release factor 2